MKLAVATVSAAAAAACALAAPDQPDPAAGERAYQKCTSCHALEAGANTPAGPTLHRIVGRPVAAEPGFAFSPALRQFAQRNPRWTAGLIDAYARDPEALVPGTAMSFHGMPDAAERRVLILYLEKKAGRTR